MEMIAEFAVSLGLVTPYCANELFVQLNVLSEKIFTFFFSFSFFFFAS
jgi:hypothetical protein